MDASNNKRSRRLVIASESANIPFSWKDAEVFRRGQLNLFTERGASRRAIEWTQLLAETKVDGKRLVDMLRYEGTSLWWFIHTLIFSTAKEAVFTIEQTERLLREKTPDELLIADLGRISQLVAGVCEHNAVKYTLQGSHEWPLVSSVIDEAKVAAGSLLIRVKEFRRKRAGSVFAAKIAGRAPSVIFLSPSVNWRAIWNFEKGRTENRDVFMGNVIEEIKALGCEVTCVDIDYSLGGRINLLREKVEKDELRWVPFERYMSPQVTSRLERNARFHELKNSFQFISENERFKESLQYHSIRLWSFLEGRFRRVLSRLHLLNYAKILETAREMLRLEHPDVIAMTFETGAYARAVTVAAQEAGIPTLGIQHGFITSDSVEYIHTKTARNVSDDGCPIPTKTAVGGMYALELLTRQSSYPEDSLVVTGYPRHDDLVELLNNERSQRKDESLRSLGLSSSRRTVMVASGGFHAKYGWYNEYDKDVLKVMLELASERADLQLIVRLHPMEDGRMQRDLIGRQEGARAVTVKGERNDLLLDSDIFVTVNSATAIDALILEKPVLMLGRGGEEIPKVDLGDAVFRYGIDDLAQQVTSLVENPISGERVRLKAKAEIERHANTVDGQASASVAHVLNEMRRAHLEERNRAH